MAKRRKKAAKIREYLAAHPSAKASEVVAALAAQRVRVRPAQVYNLKSQAGKPRANGDYYADLIAAKRLADAMGGIDKALAALDALARLL
jgi:hypothetical protein